MQEAKWHKAYSGDGTSSGTTVFGVVMALLLGATALMSAIAFTGQRYFEYAIKSA
jgi:F420-0:gamma-glutamyl ligase-like protein